MNCFEQRMNLGTEIMQKAEAGEWISFDLLMKYNKAVTECEKYITSEEENKP